MIAVTKGSNISDIRTRNASNAVSVSSDIMIAVRLEEENGGIGAMMFMVSGGEITVTLGKR